jgi:hypothetical protein
MVRGIVKFHNLKKNSCYGLPTTINQILFIQEDAIATKDTGTKMFPSHQ